MKRCVVTLSILVATFVLSSPERLSAQGALTPPGAPAPTMKSLDEIYSKVTALGAAPDPSFPPVVTVPQAASPLHVAITGARQGDILGDADVKGRAGTIAAIGFNHEIVSPRDPASGLPTGRRQHKPVSFTQRIDRSTPLLYNALVNHENLSSVVFSFYGTDAVGKSVLYYRVTLTNASISGIAHRYPNFIEVSMTYQKITWEVPGKTAGEDDWETQVN